MKKYMVFLIWCFLFQGYAPAQDRQLVEKIREDLRPRALPRGSMESTMRGSSGPTKAQGEKPPMVLDIKFSINSYQISPASTRYLNALGTAISGDQELMRYTYRVEGYTCNLGSAEYNKNLSNKRAAAVVDYLMQNFHFQRRQFGVEGYGPERPIATNETEEGRTENRRVVIVNTLESFGGSKQTTPHLEVKAIYFRNNRISELSENGILTEEDRYAIEFTAKEKAFVYVCQVSDRIEKLFPNKDHSEKANPVEPGSLYRIPKMGRWFQLDDNKGKEFFIVAASKEEISSVDEICGKSRGGVVDRGIGGATVITIDNNQSSGSQTLSEKPQQFFIWQRSFIHQ